MKDLVGKITDSGLFFEEIFNAVSYILTGTIFSTALFALYSTWTLQSFNSFFTFLNLVSEYLFIVLVGIVYLYFMGQIAVFIFDLLVYLFFLLVKFLNKLTNGWKFIKNIYDFIYIKYPLHSTSIDLSVLYKNSVTKKIAEYFEISGDVRDVDRLCKELAMQKKLIKFYKYEHLFIWYKGIIISILIIAIKLFNLHYYLQFVFLILLSLFIFKEIRDLSLKIKINYIDAIITFIRQQKK